jgi:predicted cupin superfamily sugar epimerase
MNPTAAYWIENLQLTKHPEGGAFREVYRSSATMQTPGLFNKNVQERNVSTSIYFLLQDDEFSSFHRIASDELWHFYFGNTLIVYEIDSSTGKLVEHQLGINFDEGEVFQTVVKAGNWFGAKVKDGGYALCGCTVAPGFDFADFELAERKKLIAEYPQHEELITKLTR